MGRLEVMRITVETKRLTYKDEDYDAIIPYMAEDDRYGIRLRGYSLKGAADNVIGAVLHALGHKESPPRLIEFVVNGEKDDG